MCFGLTRRLAFHKTMSRCGKLCSQMRICWLDRVMALGVLLAHDL